jgi:hypothetical protein
MNDKDNIRINLAGIEMLDEQMLGMLIDSLVEVYQSKFGLDISLDEPEKPVYDAENVDFAKDYLKKFRLQ